MTYLFKLARRGARLKSLLVPALTLAFAACNTDQFAPTLEDTPVTETGGIAAVPTGTSSALAFRGGIPFGTFDMPNGQFGATFNGAMQNIWPEFLLEELAQIKSRGGKAVLMFAGSESHYKDGEGHFSMTKWKARVDRFKGVDFSSYVADGTIIGHYLIDEPQDPFNWHGEPISQATIEDMARYSKELWPGMTTIVRSEPGYMIKWAGTYRYLDAAWAQYAARRGDAGDYVRRNVAEAQQKGLALIVGLNFLNGGNPNLSSMNASEVQQYGSALLSSSYPCAFISWKHDEAFLRQPGMGTALASLSAKAANRPSTTCRKRGTQPPGEDPDPPTLPDTTTTPPQLPGVTGIRVSVKGWTGPDRLYFGLTWAGARGSMVRLYRNGVLLRRTANDGKAVSAKLHKTPGTYSFKICESGSSRCSGIARVTFR